MRRSSAVVIGVICFWLAHLPALAQSEAELVVEVTPARIDATLGDSFDIEITVTNAGAQPTVPLVAHIDITDPAQSTSVDPEDWTETLNQSLGVIPSGESRSVSWTLQPISPGTFSLYAVTLSGESEEVSASAATIIDVAFSQTLNPEGVLPVVLAGPLVIGALLFMVMRRARITEAAGTS